MAMRDRRAAPFTPQGPATKSGHLRVRPGLINEDQSLGVKIGLAVEPELAPREDVRALLLCRVRRLFLNVSPRLARKRHTVASDARTP